MAKPVLVVVDDEDASLRLLVSELESRYGAHYRIVSGRSAEEALVRLAELRAEGASVPVILADQWLPDSTGIELLAHARNIHPAARRGLLISWGDRSAAEPILEAALWGVLGATGEQHVGLVNPRVPEEVKQEDGPVHPPVHQPDGDCASAGQPVAERILRAELRRLAAHIGIWDRGCAPTRPSCASSSPR
jgi:CheY-like chemotaxis protein